MSDAAMRPSQKVLLLHGPYRAPALKVGEREMCLVHDRLVKVTSWTDARIPWPKGVPVGGRSQPSIIVDEELARAVRCESAVAIRHWWGVSVKVVWKWRKGLGVTRTNNEGSRRLHRFVLEEATAKTRGVPLPPEQVERRRRTASELNLGQHLAAARDARPGRWTEEQLKLLGTDDDEVVAKRLGKTRSAVRSQRCRLGVKVFRYRKGPRVV